MRMQIKRLRDDVELPHYKRPGDAGMDLRALETKTLAPGERYLFRLGFSVAFPEGYVALIWPRSGLAVKNGLDTLAGVIEYTYRGEWGVPLINLGPEPYEVKAGDRIAQVLFQPIVTAEVEEVEELSGTVRGEGGFGSSGR